MNDRVLTFLGWLSSAVVGLIALLELGYGSYTLYAGTEPPWWGALYILLGFWLVWLFFGSLRKNSEFGTFQREFREKLEKTRKELSEMKAND
jgi:hypothetical protein